LYEYIGGNEEEEEKGKPTDKFIGFILSQDEDVKAPMLEKMNPKTYQLFQIIQT